MGIYTVNEDPHIDRVVQGHMLRIVEEITSKIRPDSIILRGSFGRGEGSVMTHKGTLHFLSDYEIDVTSVSPFHRSFFAKLSRELSDEFGMQAGIRWMRPDCLTKDRIGPFPIGKARTTISLYEFRYGSQILWGRDLFAESPEMYPEEIDLMSGLILLLNRMAESLFIMTLNDDYIDKDGQNYYWINKTILACAESILLVLKQYHYSYQERGKRFWHLPNEKLKFLGDNINSKKEIVKKATEFKLRPNLDLYPSTVEDTWVEVLPLFESTLSFLVEEILKENWMGLSSFSELYLDYIEENPKYDNGKLALLLNLYEAYRAFRAHHRPSIFSNHPHSNDVVYSAVPLVFLSYGVNKKWALLQKARLLMSKISTLQEPLSDLDAEWDYLRKRLAYLWKVFCY